MASRRDKPAADPFGGGEDYDLETVKNALYGDIQQADRERVVRRVVTLRELYIDPAIQVRAEGLNEEHVQTLLAVLLNGGTLPPIRVFRDDESGRLYVSDGFHRCETHKRAIVMVGHEAIEPLTADIYPGGYAGAIADAEEQNLRHGLKLSPESKFGIFKRRLGRGHEWAHWSNVRIAAILGISEGTIRNWRIKLSVSENSGSQNYEPQRAKKPETRIGADGKSYPIRPPEARAQPKGLTPPTRYAHDPDVDQVLPDEEPALTYDEVEEANWPSPIVPRDEPVVDPAPSLPAWMRLSQDAAILSRHARAVLEVPRAVLDELDDETLAHLGTLMVTTQEAMVTAWDHFQGLREYMVEIVQIRMYGEEDQ